VALTFEMTATEYIERPAAHESRVAVDIGTGKMFSF
jgi:hypothetical protein